MRIKARFTIAYIISFLTIAIAAVFFIGKPESMEEKAGVFYGILFVVIVGIIISLIVEALIQTLNKKNSQIARFLIMFAALDLLFFYSSRFELVSSLLQFSGQQFQTALPVIVIHLTCYAIAATTLLFFKKSN